MIYTQYPYICHREFSGISVTFHVWNKELLYQSNVVYLFVIDTPHGKYCYVGQATHGIYHRICSHCSDCWKRTDNSKKANAIKKYKTIDAYILQCCVDDVELDAVERKYIVQYANDTRFARCLNTLLKVNGRKNRITIKSIDDKYKIHQYDLQGVFVAEYKSIRDASFHTGICRNVISKAINRKANTAGGFQWKLANDNRKMIPTHPHNRRCSSLPTHIAETKLQKKQREQRNRGIQVLQYDLTGKLINQFPSMREAARVTKVDVKGIELCCNGTYVQCNGFQFRKANNQFEIRCDLTTHSVRTAQRNVINKGKAVGGFDDSGQLIEKYPSKHQAEQAHHAYGLINNILLHTKRFGLYWKFI